MRYIYFTFPFIFFSVKNVFSVKKVLVIKLFFHIKTFFYNKHFFKKKKKNCFFQLSFATNEQPYTSHQTKSMDDHLDHTITLRQGLKETGICQRKWKTHVSKKFVKSLRYMDEFLLSTNDYYMKITSYI